MQRKLIVILSVFIMALFAKPAHAIILAPSIDGGILDGYIYSVGFVPKDGVPDQIDGDQSVQVDNSDLIEERGIMEFNVSGFSDPVTSAYLKLYAIAQSGPYPFNMALFGYSGDGALGASDFNAGSSLTPFAYNGESGFLFDVTPFLQNIKTADDDFAGFNLRKTDVSSVQTSSPYVAFGSLEYPHAAELFLNERPNTVPEPATIFLLTAGLGSGLLARRKKS